MKKAFELGIQVPQNFEGWADFFPRYTVLPWLKGAQHKRVQNMREYLRMAFTAGSRGAASHGQFHQIRARHAGHSGALAAGPRCVRVSVRAMAKPRRTEGVPSAETEGGCAAVVGGTGDLLVARGRVTQTGHMLKPGTTLLPGCARLIRIQPH